MLVSLLLVACGKKNQSDSEIAVRAPHLEFSAADTSEIYNLAQQYLACFEAKDYALSASMLYKLQNDSIIELPAEDRESYIKTMSRLPNYGAKLSGISLYTDTNNRLIYLLKVTENGNLDNEEGVMRFMLNPVRYDGRWYLTIFDPEAEGTQLLK